MVVESIPVSLKDGREAILRSVRPEDASAMLESFFECVRETPFLLTSPEDTAAMTVDDERAFIEGYLSSPTGDVLLGCFVGGRLAGTGGITFNAHVKTRHRAGLSIAIRREFWGLGIGTAMLGALIRVAESREYITQLELDFFEGNSRARALYEKMGFRIVSCHPDAVRLEDGSFRNSYLMIRKTSR